MNYGTNQPEKITLPISVDLIKTLEMTYKQNETVLRKHKDDVELSGNKVTIPFTQEETFMFEPEIPLKSQLRLVTIYNEDLKSRIYTQYLEDTLSREVLT